MIFRAYDVRGVYGEDLTDETMEDIGRALGTFAGHGEVLVAGDCRLSTGSLKSALVSGLISTGCGVLLVKEPVPFGLALFTGKKADIVAYVTASHSPAEWNGVKFYRSDGVALSNGENKKILELFESKRFASGEGSLQELKPAMKDYVSYMKKNFPVKKKVRIVVDTGNGATSKVVPKVLAAIGCDVTTLFDEPDGRFPNRKPDVRKEDVEKLTETVKKVKADLGVAFDGDGDRMAVVDDTGRYLEPEEIAFIIARNLGGRKVVATVECSRILDDLGFEIVRIPVGHTYLTKASQDRDVVVGVEASGHLTVPSYSPFDDAVLVACKFCQVVAGHKLSDEADKIPHYMRRRTNFDCSDEKKFQIVESLKRGVKGNVDTMDGLRINFGDAWVLIRASNTGPLIRMTVEAKDEKRMEELEKIYGSMVRRETG